MNESGELAPELSNEALNMAYFLIAIIGDATKAYPFKTDNIEVDTPCINDNCDGDVYCLLRDPKAPIIWYCTKCNTQGNITEWQGTKWDDAKNK